MITYPFVSVIVPTYHDWGRLTLCINALNRQTYPKEFYEVIIVNNDPSDAVPSGYAIPDNFRIVDEVKPGSYAARNKGIGLAKGEIYGFTDSDCIPHPTWIENAAKKFQENTIDRVAGNIELIYQDSNDRTWVELYESIYEFDQERIVRVHKASVTANLFVRKELFDKVGLFDSSKMSGEDFGWNRRANLQNYNIIYGDDVKISHPSRSTFKEFENKKRREFGGKKGNRSKGMTRILKDIVYVPYLFYTIIIRKSFLLYLKEDRLSLIDKTKVTVVNVYSYLILVTEFFKIVLGGQRAR